MTWVTIQGVPPPYENAFTLWGHINQAYQTGSVVPDAGMSGGTYSILLSHETAPDRFIWVQEYKLTNLLAHQVQTGKNVFSPSGNFLGKGGEALLRPTSFSGTPRSLLEMVEAGETITMSIDPQSSKPSIPETNKMPVWPSADAVSVTGEPSYGSSQEPPKKTVVNLTHIFYIRPDCKIEFTLPANITEEEAERLVNFIRTLPF